MSKKTTKVSTFKRITGFDDHDNITVASDHIKYGLAMKPAEEWMTWIGSYGYILGVYAGANTVRELTVSDDCTTEMEIILYELDEDLKPISVIKSLSLTGIQNVSIGNSNHGSIIRDLTIVNVDSPTPFHLEF